MGTFDYQPLIHPSVLIAWMKQNPLSSITGLWQLILRTPVSPPCPSTTRFSLFSLLFQFYSNRYGLIMAGHEGI